jgi:ubiquinone/menaquinone biosynthesis C-methylase UbiE
MMNDELRWSHYSSFIVHHSSFPPMPFDSKKTWNACGEAFDRYTSTEDSFSDNIERPAIERLIGEIQGRRALDLGCGSGAYSHWLMARGAQVLGVDVSETMISLAASKGSKLEVRADFCIADLNKPLPLDDDLFDIVLTATALHYVEKLEELMREVRRVMKRGASFVASVLHPIATARFPVDSEATDIKWQSRSEWETKYFGHSRRTIETPWMGFAPIRDEGQHITCYHHTTADYFGAIQSAGLRVTALCEPEPPAEFSQKNPARYDEALSVPIYLLLKAVKA